ncbi:MAG: hypothetical protein WDZ75_01695 [Candidatus Paceibacterota bacterium]
MALFDPATYSQEQAAMLNNTPGKSLSETNTAEQISAAQAITPQSLTPTQSFPLVTPTPIQSYPVGTLQVPDMQATDQEKTISEKSTALGGLYNKLIGKSAFQSEQEAKFGADEARKSITDLSSRLTSLKNEALAIPLQMEEKIAKDGTILKSAFNDQQDSRLRSNAIAALGVSSLLSASQGQLANATALAERAVSQKYDPIVEQIESLKANLELIINDPRTSLQDKNRARAQLEAQNLKAESTALARESASQVWEIATTAAANSSGFKPSGIYTSLAKTLQAISSAPTKEQALQIASQTGLIGTGAGSTTADIKEYEVAKSQGFKGTFQQWVDRTSQYKGGSTGTGSTSSITFDSAAKALQSQRIPSTALSKDTTMALSYKRKLLDQGVETAVIDWLWKAVISGTSFDEIREAIRNGGGDTKVLDTFVVTLQS